MATGEDNIKDLREVLCDNRPEEQRRRCDSAACKQRRKVLALDSGGRFVSRRPRGNTLKTAEARLRDTF